MIHPLNLVCKIYPTLCLAYIVLHTMSESEDECSQQVFLELDKEHYEEDPVLSTPLMRVLRFVKLETHESVGLSEVAGMVRGDAAIITGKLKGVYLGVIDPNGSGAMGLLGRGVPTGSDPRVHIVSEWTPKCPLPLGGKLFPNLRMVFHLSEPLADDETLKLGGDIIAVPPLYLNGSPKMKRILTWDGKKSTLRLRGGTVLCLETPLYVLSPTLNEMAATITLQEDVVPTEKVSLPSEELLIDPLSKITVWDYFKNF
jgi:hypothetical protein